MTYTHSITGNHALISLSGELDSHAAHETIVYISGVIDLFLPQTLSLDLSRLTFMDSSGLAVVLGAYKRMQELDGTLRVLNAGTQPMKVFSAVRLERLIAFE